VWSIQVTGRSVPSFPRFRTSTTLPSINLRGLEINYRLLSMVGIPSLSLSYLHPLPCSQQTSDEGTWFFHIGTSISVYGTIDTPILRGSPNATFRVDDLPVAYFNSTGSVLVFLDMMNSHVLLYELSGLYKTTHTLTIETLAASNPAARFYIDFFTVSTGSDSAYGYIIVDDRDPSIVYTGAWSDYGIPLEYMSTTKLAPQNGYGGSAMVPFNGTYIAGLFLSICHGLIHRHRNDRNRLRHDIEYKRARNGGRSRVLC